MIRLDEELKNYPHIDLQTLEDRGENLPEDIKNSIVLYNKALDKLRLKSEDIAIIELKKAISLNPHFYEAMNLLGLCYGLSKENAKAVEVLNRVIDAEKNSIKALEYMKLIDGGGEIRKIQKSTSKKERESEKKDKGIAAIEKVKPIMSQIDIIKVLCSDWFKYGIGILVGAAVVFIIQFAFTNKNEAVYVSNEIKKPAIDVKTSNEYEEKYKQLDKEYQKLQKEFKEVNDELGYYKGSSKISEAEKMFEERKYEEAADILVQLRQYQFNETESGRVSSLEEKAFPRATWSAYAQGRDAFDNRDYAAAVAKLSKVQSYGGNWEYVPDALYKLVLGYIELNDKAKAESALKYFREKYPGSNLVNDAEARLTRN